MPEIVKLDILEDKQTGRVGLRLGSDNSGSHTLIVTAQQALEIAEGIRRAAHNVGAEVREVTTHATH